MSMQRRCDIIKATDGKWYLILGNFEHAEEKRDCSVYGGFYTMEDVENKLDEYCNPGGFSVDDSGTMTPEEIKR